MGLSTMLELYSSRQLAIDEAELERMVVSKSSSQRALRYLAEAYFDFVANGNEFMTLRLFEQGLEACGISTDHRDVTVVAFQQLAVKSKSKRERKRQKVLISRASMTQWMVRSVSSSRNTNYANYAKHFREHFRW